MFLLELAVAAGTLTFTWAAGSRRWWAWHLALAVQVLWWALIVAGRSWGLTLMAAPLTVVYARNALRSRTNPA